MGGGSDWPGAGQEFLGLKGLCFLWPLEFKRKASLVSTVPSNSVISEDTEEQMLIKEWFFSSSSYGKNDAIVHSGWPKSSGDRQ